MDVDISEVICVFLVDTHFNMTPSQTVVETGSLKASTGSDINAVQFMLALYVTLINCVKWTNDSHKYYYVTKIT